MSASVADDIVRTLLAWGCSSSFSGPEHSTVSQSRVTKCWDAEHKPPHEICGLESQFRFRNLKYGSLIYVNMIYMEYKTKNTESQTVQETQQSWQSSMITVISVMTAFSERVLSHEMARTVECLRTTMWQKHETNIVFQKTNSVNLAASEKKTILLECACVTEITHPRIFRCDCDERSVRIHNADSYCVL